MNHILKMNQNWTPNKLPDLVDKIHKEVKFQETLIRGALYGHGDFELANPNHPMKISKLAWDNKTSEQQNFEKIIKKPSTKTFSSLHLQMEN